jgi:DNA-directed RNA polymerase subunit RPC12/RpoP
MSMLKYAGGTSCPKCRSMLVLEYDCSDCMQADAIIHGDQRLVCPGCGYARQLAYVVERRRKVADSR